MNWFEGIGKTIDWINRLFSRIKGLGYIIALVVFVVFFINNGCKRNQAEQLVEKITGLNIQNDLLLKANNEISKELSQKQAEIDQKNHQIDSIIILKDTYKNKANYWEKEHDKISDQLLKITSDSSYQFLLSVFDYPGELKYPFNEPQIKSLHQTYLENKMKGEELEFQKLALLSCENTLDLLKQTQDLEKDKFELKDKQYKNLDKVASNKEEEAALLRKQLKRTKFWSRVKDIGIGVAFVVGILI